MNKFLPPLPVSIVAAISIIVFGAVGPVRADSDTDVLPDSLVAELAEADSLDTVIDDARQAGDWRRGAEAAERQLSTRLRILGEDHLDVARSYNSLGIFSSFLGNYEKTEKFTRAALEIRRTRLGDRHMDVAECLNNLAHCVMNSDRFHEAVALFRETLSILRETMGEDNMFFGMTLDNLAGCLMEMGNYAEAELLSRRALAIHREALGESHVNVAHNAGKLALILKTQGRYFEAEPFARNAVDIYRKELGDSHLFYADGVNNLAGVIRRQGKLDEAEELYREALEVRRKAAGPESDYVAASIANMGVVLKAKGAYEEAEAYYAEALARDTLRLGWDDSRVGLDLHNLADLLHYQGKLEKAKPIYERALEIRGKSIGAEHPRLVGLNLGIGRLHRALGDLGAAEHHIAEACRVFEIARSTAGEGLARTTFESSPYPDHAALMLLMDRSDEAWPLIELAHGRLLSETWATTDLRKSSEKASLGSLQEVLNNDEAFLGWLDIDPPGGPSASWGYVVRASGPVRWFELEQLEEDAWLDLRKQVLTEGRSSLGAIVTERSKDAERALWLNRFAPLEAALDGIRSLQIVPSGFALHIPVEQLRDTAGHAILDKYRVTYAPSGAVLAVLKKRPPAADTPQGRIALFVGDPPFNDRHLAEMHDGVAHPTMTMLATSQATHLGNPLFRSGITRSPEALSKLPRLAWSRQEVTRASQLFEQPEILLGPDASEERISDMATTGVLERFSVLHFASHAFVDDEIPEQSALILSQIALPDRLEAAIIGETAHDGVVTLAEVASEWSIDADLVTLSACETGLGRIVKGEGHIGFTQSLLQAGARSVLVSLWEVDDEASSLLMQRFYENYQGKYEEVRDGNRGIPMSKVAALREAKIWLRDYENEEGRRPYEHPFYWSSAVLIGSPD